MCLIGGLFLKEGSRPNQLLVSIKFRISRADYLLNPMTRKNTVTVGTINVYITGNHR